jgi:hypothetical protein
MFIASSPELIAYNYILFDVKIKDESCRFLGSNQWQTSPMEKEKKKITQVSLAIRGGYVPKKIRPANTKTDNLSLN